MGKSTPKRDDRRKVSGLPPPFYVWWANPCSNGPVTMIVVALGGKPSRKQVSSGIRVTLWMVTPHICQTKDVEKRQM